MGITPCKKVQASRVHDIVVDALRATNDALVLVGEVQATTPNKTVLAVRKNGHVHPLDDLLLARHSNRRDVLDRLDQLERYRQ